MRIVGIKLSGNKILHLQRTTCLMATPNDMDSPSHAPEWDEAGVQVRANGGSALGTEPVPVRDRCGPHVRGGRAAGLALDEKRS